MAAKAAYLIVRMQKKIIGINASQSKKKNFGIRVEPNTWVDSLEVNHQSTKVE